MKLSMQIEDKHNERHQPVNNRLVIRKLLFMVVVMFSFGYALVPLYDVFCDVTGLNGKTGDRVNLINKPVVDVNRKVRVTFLASLNASMPWKFKPQKSFVDVHPGETTTIYYIASNTTTKTMTGQAVPSVAPGLAAAYFQKTECFCFTEQALKPGEEKIMPVTFIVDSQLPQHMNELILSYTFFTSNKKTTNLSPSQSLSLNQDHKL